MNKEALEEVVAGLIRTMPPEDENVERLLQAAGSHSSPQEVARIVAGDPHLCADLLYLANSPCWKMGRSASPVDTIEDALELLGVEPLCMLVGPSFVRQAVKPGIVESRHWHDYEQHSREISIACRALSSVMGLSEHEQQRYCTAGLTHDIGRAVIMLAGEPDAAALVGTSPDRLDEIIADEEKIYGLNHCSIGERLFKKWHVSKIMSEGILRHHTPMLEDDLCLPGAVIFISHFVTMSDMTGEIIAKMLPERLLKAMHLTGRDIEAAREVVTGQHGTVL